MEDLVLHISSVQCHFRLLRASLPLLLTTGTATQRCSLCSHVAASRAVAFLLLFVYVGIRGRVSLSICTHTLYHPASTHSFSLPNTVRTLQFERLPSTRVLIATILDNRRLFPETPSPFSQIRSGAKDCLDFVSSQFRESHNIEDSLFPILVSGGPKREGLDLIPLGSLQGQQSPSLNQPPPRPLDQPNNPSPTQSRSRGLQPQLTLSRDSPTFSRADPSRPPLEYHLLQNPIRNPRSCLPIKIRQHPGREAGLEISKIGGEE